MTNWNIRLALALSFACAACGGKAEPKSNIDPPEDSGETVADRCAPADLSGSLAGGSWDPRFTVAGLTGHDGQAPTVYDFAVDPEGRLLAAGRFHWNGSDVVGPLARLEAGTWKPAQSTWTREPPPGGFSAVASAPDGKLALATHRTLAPRGGEIWLDGEPIATFSGAVRRMEWVGDRLWVAGSFELDGVDGALGLAVWDGNAWSPAPGGPADGSVFALMVEDGHVWAGGAFDAIGGIESHGLAEWDGETWIAHDVDLPRAVVYAIARDGDELYLGGGLYVEEGEMGHSVGGILRRNDAGWELVGGGVAAGYNYGMVSDLLVHGGYLYATGCFSFLGGGALDPDAIPSRAFARWSGTEWEPLDDGSEGGVGTVWFTPSVCGDEGPFAIWDSEYQRLFVHDGKVHAGGAFPGVAGVASQSVIAFDGERWLPATSAGAGVSGEVGDLSVGGAACTPYALGGLTHAGGSRVPSGVARFDGGWKAVGTALPDGLFNCVRVAVDKEERVFVGCSIDGEGEPLARVLRWSGAAWEPVGEPHELVMLHDMALDPAGRLWIVGGTEKGWVARLDDDHFTVVEDGFDGMVYRLAFGRTRAKGVSDFPMVVAGVFEAVGSQPARRIAHWDGAAWTPLGEGAPAFVEGLALGKDGVIYASTQEEWTGERFVLAAWDGKTWTELGTPARGLPAPMEGTVHTFMRLLERDGTLIATGYVWPEDGARNAFVYDGEKFSPVARGVPAISVVAIGLTPDGLWLGGSIAEVVDADGHHPSVGVARFEW
ncbi:hypothetical protein [Vulgatibacter incomptus]|nr:hypothetical protein [Vulgatibacter incomptus]